MRIAICRATVLVSVCLIGTGVGLAHGIDQAKSPLNCRAIKGLQALLVPGKVLLLGEMHGTAQSPAFVANTACLALRANRSVVVALEIPQEDQARADSFVESAGSVAERAAFLDSPFWTATFQDGRRSVAMLSLFEEIRRERRAGWPIRVKLIDRLAAPSVPAERDKWMAQSLAAAHCDNPSNIVIALTGDVHTRILKGAEWDSRYEPMGFALHTLRPDLDLLALDVDYQSGTAWFCFTPQAATCGVHQVHGRGAVAARRIELRRDVTTGYNGVYGVGAITASPPASELH
jgi:hypothetical protein